ncbi:hypothetical protein AB0G15_42405 [Streptosporangium sp. NPDC023825]|uniref:hypothetical protein n=1 Tax=Streptosporangium sp. NPDC023825 TaxID=3154909 RepID=UPI0034240C3B
MNVDTADPVRLPQILPVHREWLLSNIRAAGGILSPVQRDTSAESATKSPMDLLSLLVPASAVPIVAQVIKAWLKERGRIIVFQTTHNGKTTTLRLSGAVSDDTVREVLKQAVPQDDVEE